jgi:hypothetical protein
VVTKKSEAWKAIITTSSTDHAALAASLACEEVECTVSDGDIVTVSISGTSASDLRAKYNSTMRSLRAASDTLQQIQR